MRQVTYPSNASVPPSSATRSKLAFVKEDPPSPFYFSFYITGPTDFFAVNRTTLSLGHLKSEERCQQCGGF